MSGVSRRRLCLLAATAGLALAIGWAGVTRVPPGSVSVLPDGALLPPGWHLGLSSWRGVRMGPGLLEVEGIARVESPEGAQLEIPYRAGVNLEEAAIAALAADPGGGSPQSRLQRAVEAALRAAAAQDGESFALLRAGPGQRRALAALSERPPLPGSRVTDLRIGAAAGGRGRASPLARVILVGLDGADWKIIQPLMAAGKLPTLERLAHSGARAHLRSAPPLLSPLLWTTMATGLPPDWHGIVDFTVWDPATRDRAPISSRARKVPALWNILTAYGLHSAWFGWWATWPAEPVSGIMASDRVAYSLFATAGDEKAPGRVYPPEAGAALRQRQTVAQDLPWSELGRFARLPPADLALLGRRAPPAPGADFEDRRDHLRQVLAATRTYHGQARWARVRLVPDLLAVYFQGIDEISHRFMHYVPPRRARLPAADSARYAGTVEAFYRYQDEILGRLLEPAPGEESAPLVMVVSDHGFLSGAARPPHPADEFEGGAADWHRLHGIFLLSGPQARRADLGTVSLYDIFPTLLYLCGIPLPDGLPGRPLLEALDPALTRAHPPTRIASLDVPFGPEVDAPASFGQAGDAEAMARLRALGYVGGAAARGPAAGNEFLTAHMNLGTLHAERGEWESAAREYRSVAERFASYAPAFYKWMESEFRRGDAKAAWRVAALLLEMKSFPADWLPYVAEVGAASGETARVRQALTRLSAAGGAEDGARLAALGILELREGRATGASALFRRSLEADPLRPEPLDGLYALDSDPAARLRLIPVLGRALELAPRSLLHLNYLAGILTAAGRCSEARPLLAEALEENPESAPAHVNLGKCQAHEGRMDDAVATLEHGLAGAPHDLGLLTTLGALEAARGNLARGIEILERARAIAPADTGILNALGLARLQSGEPAGARELLERSLAANPSQPDVRSLLEQIPR